MTPERRRRLRRAAAAALVLAALLADWSRPPARQWSARGEVALLHAYRAGLSPWLARAGVSCRFEPTCSRYAEAVIRRDGGLVGPLRAAWRVLRCGPWTAPGTADPP